MTETRLDQIKIPSAPLLAHVERLGGVAELPGMGLMVKEEIENPRPITNFGKGDSVISIDAIDRTPEEWRRFKNTYQQLRRARQRGWISLAKADEFCCETLGIHPMEVWGMEWFGFGLEDDVEMQEAA